MTGILAVGPEAYWELVFERKDHRSSDKEYQLFKKSRLLCSVLQAEKFNATSMWSANGFNKAPQSFNILKKMYPPPMSAITATDGDNTLPETK